MLVSIKNLLLGGSVIHDLSIEHECCKNKSLRTREGIPSIISSLKSAPKQCKIIGDCSEQFNHSNRKSNGRSNGRTFIKDDVADCNLDSTFAQDYKESSNKAKVRKTLDVSSMFKTKNASNKLQADLLVSSTKVQMYSLKEENNSKVHFTKTLSSIKPVSIAKWKSPKLSKA